MVFASCFVFGANAPKSNHRSPTHRRSASELSEPGGQEFNWRNFLMHKKRLAALPSPFLMTISASGRSAFTKFLLSACLNVCWKAGAKKSMKSRSPLPARLRLVSSNSTSYSKKPGSKFILSSGLCLPGPQQKPSAPPLDLMHISDVYSILKPGTAFFNG